MHFINEMGLGTATIMLLNAQVNGKQWYNPEAFIAFEHTAAGFPVVYVEVRGNVVYEQEHYGTCNRKEVFIEALNTMFGELKRQGIEWRF